MTSLNPKCLDLLVYSTSLTLTRAVIWKGETIDERYEPVRAKSSSEDHAMRPAEPTHLTANYSPTFLIARVLMAFLVLIATVHLLYASVNDFMDLGARLLISYACADNRTIQTPSHKRTVRSRGNKKICGASPLSHVS